MDRLQNAIDRFDDYNKQDPNTVTWQDVQYPAEYFYALKLYDWVLKLETQATEPLLLASRSQHIGRWQIPRSDYPMHKAGYLTWRSDLAKFHAQTAGKLMMESGYDSNAIEHVQRIILKKNIKADAEVQVIENALCLVFLEFQYEDFLSKHDDDKVIRIIKKSWAKMSEPGRYAALQLKYTDTGMQLIQAALS
jgi:hypothetical protein